MSIENLKVVNLNCWGVFVPLACQKKSERLNALRSKLSDGYYDIILLEEIWTMDDYEELQDALKGVYPNNHYFHSKIIGSGCCIFTKFNIKSVFFNRFSANGYPHAIYHGDWLGGKGVGLAVVETKQKYILNIYITHFIARYKHDEDTDGYHYHRIVQGYEMGEFIRLTSKDCDGIIVGGDFNMGENMLGYKLIITPTNLHDTWYNRENCPPESPMKDIATCDRPDSPYCNKTWQKWYPDGERLDYLLFKSNSNKPTLRCLNCKHVLKETPNIPGHHYSDHVGIEAQFAIGNIQHELKPIEIKPEPTKDALINLYQSGFKSTSKEYQRINKLRYMDFLIFLVFLLSIIFDYPNKLFDTNYHIIYRLITSMQAIICFISFYYFLCIRRAEYYILRNMEQYFRLKLKCHDEKKMD